MNIKNSKAQGDIDDIMFPKECIEYLMNKQGATSPDINIFSIVSRVGQMYIEECLKKSIQTSNDGKFIIKNDNLKNFIGMENVNNTVKGDYTMFLMSSERYKKLLNESFIK